MESSLNVCDAIINVIDKNELIREYDEYSTFDDIIMESMMIFMESKNRERDKTPRNEISRWMEKKGFWYTGDNPKKKKECNRFYHFLQQHKFNPADGTYETSFKTKDGSYKRIKLDINAEGNISITDEDKKNIQSLLEEFGNTNENGKKYIDMKKLKEEGIGIVFDKRFESLTKYDLLESVITGYNAFYNSGNESITIGAKALKGKQAISQFTLKHEEGHAEDIDPNSNVPRTRHTEINKEKRKSDIYRKSTYRAGMLSNSHDDDSKENAADLYAVQNTEKRGKKGTRKKLNQKDLNTIYKDMDRSISASEDVIVSIKDCESNIDKMIKVCESLIDSAKKDPEMIMQFNVDYLSKTKVNALVHADNRYRIIVNKIAELKKELDITNNNELMDKEDRLRKEELEYRKKLTTIQNQLDQLEDWENIPFDDTSSNKYDVKKAESLEKEYNKLLEAIDQIRQMKEAIDTTLYSEDHKKEHEKNIHDMISKTKDKKTRFSMENIGSNLTVPKELLTKIHNEAGGDEKKAYKMIADYYVPSFKRWITILKKKKQNLSARLKALGEFKDVSTAVRYSFAKKYIKEYFDVFADEFDLYME